MREAENLQASSIRYWTLRHLEGQPTLQAEMKCVLLPTAVVSSVSWVSVTESSLIKQRGYAYADQVVPVFVLDLGLRAYVKMRRNHNVGDVFNVEVAHVNAVFLDLELVEKV